MYTLKTENTSMLLQLFQLGDFFKNDRRTYKKT